MIDPTNKISYADACKKMFANVIARIKKDPEKYLDDEVKAMLIELDIDINDAEMIDALLTQWQDNERLKNKDGTMSAFAKYMEDVRLIVMNQVLGNFFTAQLIFGNGTYNREVASIPCKNVIIPGMMTAKGEPVSLYSPEWTWKASNAFFEQYCHKKGISMNDSSSVQKEVLKKIYINLSKKILECKLQDSDMAVYMNTSIISMMEASDIQIKISQYMYGDEKNTCALVSTSGGGSHSFDIMNKDILQSSGGISYINEEGKKKIAALKYKRTTELMSKAVDDALAKQAEEAAEAAENAKTAEDIETAKDAETAEVPYTQSEKKRRTEAPFRSEIPIINKDGKILTIPFPNFSTHKTQFYLNQESNNYKTKGFGSRSTRGDAGATKGGRNYEEEEEEVLKVFDDITITICERGDDICEMPLIAMNIPDNPTFTLQPGNFQITVVLIDNHKPPEFRGAKLLTDADVEREQVADTIYFVNKILKNSLKARIHMKNELKGVLNSNNTKVLIKADFNHFDLNKMTPDDELLLKNSVSDLLKNRYNPFDSDMPDFANFDIEKICQECDKAKILDPAPVSDPTLTQESELILDPAPAPTPAPAPASVPVSALIQESEFVLDPVSDPVSDPTLIQELEFVLDPVTVPDPDPDSDPVAALNQALEIVQDPVPAQVPVPVPAPVPAPKHIPVPMQINFIKWNKSQALLISLCDKPLCCSAPKIYLDIKQHDGKDDEVGEQIDQKFFEMFDMGTYRHVKCYVEEELLIRVNFKITNQFDITSVYITDAGIREPETEIRLEVDETKELFPLQKEAGEEPDSWEICSGSEILLKITFILK